MSPLAVEAGSEGAVVAASEARDAAVVETTVFGTAVVALALTGAVDRGTLTEGIPVPEP